ncbi:MAG: glucosamine-6-phosphate deaminase [Verrucomicrobia bacterium]|nr:glucosamine-6-phosphate deaminase [Verrucomicrobiota bacterium]
MLLYVVDDAEAMGRLAADLIEKEMSRTLALKEAFVLGLPTGNTPIPLYRELVRRHRDEGLDFSSVVTFNLDEYGGLGKDDADSLRTYMHEHLFDHINLKPENAHVPDGLAPDLDAEAEAYEASIDAAGGIDLLVLGIGLNGHVGFNEPGSSLGSLTRTRPLRGEAREIAAAVFGGADRAPGQVITMGCGTILKASKIMMLASGAKKAKIVREAFEGPITAMVPASVLQLHRLVTAVVTSDCARLLTIEPEPLR